MFYINSIFGRECPLKAFQAVFPLVVFGKYFYANLEALEKFRKLVTWAAHETKWPYVHRDKKMKCYTNKFWQYCLRKKETSIETIFAWVLSYFRVCDKTFWGVYTNELWKSHYFLYILYILIKHASIYKVLQNVRYFKMIKGYETLSSCLSKNNVDQYNYPVFRTKWSQIIHGSKTLKAFDITTGWIHPHLIGYSISPQCSISIRQRQHLRIWGGDRNRTLA